MLSDERDQQFERALQRRLGGKSADATCPDAEILAAYHERLLSLEEMGQWKEHVAACTRCQGAMVLLEETNSVPLHEWERKSVPVRSEPTIDPSRTVIAAARRSSVESAARQTAAAAPRTAAVSIRDAVPRPKWRWIVPAGAMAAGLLIFVAVREYRSELVTGPVHVAENRGSTMPAARAPAPVPEATGADQLSPGVKQDVLSLAETPVKKGATVQKSISSSQMARMPSAGAKTSAALGGTAALRNETADGGLVVRTPKPTAPPLSTLRAGSASGVGTVTMQNRAPAVIRPAQSQASDTGSEMVGSADASSEAAPVQPRAYIPVKDIPFAVRSYIAAPRGKVFWRVGVGGKIEISTDAAKSWRLQNSGVSNEIVGGSAPSEKMCWVVGTAGTVLLTLDGGAHWKRVTPPVAEDLTGVRAQDAQHATVWAAQSRKSFETTDGGTTWTPAASE